MDILYYIGDGSHHNNEELRYSLRALEKHCKDIDEVWIVGNKPHFLNDKVKYLWVADSGEWWQNAFYKTMAAIKAGISKQFLLMNDDFYMLEDFCAAKYPYYNKGEIMDVVQNKYQEVIINTKRVLKSLGKPSLHFGVHCPMRIDGEKYMQLAKFFEGKNEGVPVSARCLYGNLYCKNSKTVSDNKKVQFSYGETGCFSSKEWVVNETLGELKKMFDTPSKYEREDL